jgi:RNA ligase
VELIHPARTIPFRVLHDGLREAQAQKYVNENKGPDGLSLYSYTKSCVYERAWNDYTLLARGLILDHRNEQVVATPFPKFFNAFELAQPIPDLPFEAFEKIDGSLIILFWRDEWIATTKGSFVSTQAKQARQYLGDLSGLEKGTTYLLEYVGPENRIVVGYPEPKLYLLSAYDQTGYEIDYETGQEIAARTGWSIAARQYFSSFAEAEAYTKELPATQEGHVVRFSNGLRLKIKGDEYCRIHSLISGATPLGIWDMMRNNQDLLEMRKILPEEFLGDFDQIKNLLDKRVSDILDQIKHQAECVSDLTDKELGLRIHEIAEPVRKFIFAYRRHGDLVAEKHRIALFQHIRPTGNSLEGYVPSYSMNQVTEDL